MKSSILFAIASAASFVAAAATFLASNPGLGAVFVANGTLFIALSVRARASEGPRS